MEALRAEMDRLAEQVAAAQELLGRLELTRQTVVEVLAGDGLPGGDAVVIDPEAGVGAAAPTAGTKVPVFGQDGQVGGRGLPVAYRDVVEVLADAGPLRARQVCQARLAAGRVRTGFERGITAFGLLLVRAMVVLVTANFVVNLVLHHPLVESLLFSLALAVGLTPQLLPAIVSVSLSTGARLDEIPYDF